MIFDRISCGTVRLDNPKFSIMHRAFIASNWSGSIIIFLLLLLVAWPTPAFAFDENEYSTHVVPILKTYCYECHGDGVKEGDLELDRFTSEEHAVTRSDLWWNILKNVRSHVMPPIGHKRPSPEDADTLAKWIKFRAFQIDPQNIDPGRTSVRRLNRTEYGNTVSDLMAFHQRSP
jgi:hypothetical protein